MGPVPCAAVAEEVAEPPPHFVGLVGTTVVERPQGSPVAGPAGVWDLRVGIGGMFSRHFAFELDGGPAFAGSEYAAFELTSGVVWAMTDRLYASARILVGVDPPLSVAGLPGVGMSFPLSPAIHLITQIDARIGLEGSIGALLSTGIVFES